MGRHEGSCCWDMLQRHVPGTKRCVVHTAATCIRVVWRGHVAEAKSQHLNTHENVCGYMFQGYAAAICCSDVPMKFDKWNFMGHIAEPKSPPNWSGALNGNIVQNNLNIALSNVF